MTKIAKYVRDKKCPICNKYNNNSYHGLAKHIAMKGNLNPEEEHSLWRANNGLLDQYQTAFQVEDMVEQIMRIFVWSKE